MALLNDERVVHREHDKAQPCQAQHHPFSDIRIAALQAQSDTGTEVRFDSKVCRFDGVQKLARFNTSIVAADPLSNRTEGGSLGIGVDQGIESALDQAAFMSVALDGIGVPS